MEICQMPFETNIDWETELDNIVQFIEADSKPTYQKIGDIYGVSRERIRQVSHKYGFNHLIKNKKYTKKQKQLEEKQVKSHSKWGNKADVDPVLYSAYREKFRMKAHGAKQKGLEFTIKFGELVFPEYCPVLGIKIDYFATKRSENSLSWDRIDPTKGYVSGNVCLMSWRANRIKNDGTKEEHQLIVDFLNKMEGTPI